MQPYYQDDCVTLYHGDCRDILPALPAAHLLVADPPYDLWSSLAEPVLSHPTATVLAFTSWQHRQHVEACASSKFGRARSELIWHFRDGRWVAHHLPRLTHTSILVYGEVPHDAYVGDVNIDRSPQKKGTGSVGKDRMAPHTYIPRERKLLPSVLEAPRNPRSGLWTKPQAIMKPLVEWLVPDDGLLIDAFCGAGSALVVARDLGLQSIGIDVDEKMLAATVAALAQGQLTL